MFSAALPVFSTALPAFSVAGALSAASTLGELHREILGLFLARLDLIEEQMQTLERNVAKAVARLEQMGIALKDPSQGLIDFYAYRDDEMVELCWKLGEESVAHWHRIGEGFAGRKRL